MQITIKMKLDSGKEIELTEDEYQELQIKWGKIIKEPYFVPYTPNPWPNYQRPDPWYVVTYSTDRISIDNLNQEWYETRE